MPPEHPPVRPALATRRRLTKTSARPTARREPLDQGVVDFRFAALVRSGVLTSEDPPADALGEHEVAADRQPTAPEPLRVWPAEPSDVRLTDVAGLRAAKRVVVRRIRALISGRGEANARASHLLLYGPDGCGKSLLAQAVAGELGAGFVDVDAADLTAPAGARAVDAAWSALFDLAGRTGSTVIFIDHADLLPADGAERLRAAIAATASRPCPVMIILATEQIAAIAPALHDEPAFADPVFVGAPGRAARAQIFTAHLLGRLTVGVSVKDMAKATPGLSGGDIASICERAADEAALDGLLTGRPFVIGMADLAAQNAQTIRSIAIWRQAQGRAVRRGA